jgi:hypothetical protein
MPTIEPRQPHHAAELFLIMSDPLMNMLTSPTALPQQMRYVSALNEMPAASHRMDRKIGWGGSLKMNWAISSAI